MGTTASSPSADVGTRGVPGSARHDIGSGEVRRHVSALDGLHATMHSDVTTVYEAFERGVRLAGDKPCLGTRDLLPAEDGDEDDGASRLGDFAWETYADVRRQRDAIATVIESRGFAAEVRDDSLPPPVWDFDAGTLASWAADAEAWTPDEVAEDAAKQSRGEDAGPAPLASAAGAAAAASSSAAAADPRPGSGARFNAIACMSKNRAELVVLNHACYRQSCAVVPLYDTLGADATIHALGLTGVTAVFAAGADAPKVVAAKARADRLSSAAGGGSAEKCEVGQAELDRCASSLRTLVSFDGLSDDVAKEAAAAGLEVHLWGDLMAEGLEAAEAGRAAEAVPPRPSTVECVCFTSGTTGVPKGVVLTHGAVVASASGPFRLGLRGAFSPDDVYLSYLPYAHLFGRVLHCALVTYGVRIGFYSGDPRLIVDDLRLLRPTVFPSVPRLFSRIRDKVSAKVAATGGVAATLFGAAVAAKTANLRATGVATHSFWDWAVLGKVKAGVGLDRVRFMLTGSAPMAPETLEWLRVVFGIPVLEGYGQTEDAGAAFLTSTADLGTTGHVGSTFPSVEAKLVSAPALEARVTDTAHADAPCSGRGEVWMRGPLLFRGYLGQPDKTAATLTPDGWLRTGDLGMWDSRGRLRIIGRVKQQFKLAQGEYVAPEKVEGAYTNAAMVQQCFLYGDSLKSRCVAVVVPDPEALAAWASGKGLGATDAASVVTDHLHDLRAELDRQMKAAAKEAGIKGFERAAAFRVEPEAWDVDNGMLTPTFKLKRPQAEKRYAEAIREMYGELGE